MTLKEPASLETRWSAIRTTLRQEIGDASYQSWIGVLGVDGVDGSVVRLCAPNRFICDKVADRFGDRLTTLWRESGAGVEGVVIVVGPTGAAPADIAGREAPARRRGGRLNLCSAEPPPEPINPHENGLDPRYRFESFVVGKSNELAHAAARRVAEADGPAASFNPLFLYGGVGLGKTHMMHAIAWEAKARRPETTVLYVSAEKFMNRFVNALRHKDMFAFKDEFRSVDMLLVDDFQFIAGKDSTQEEFFHTFNALIDQNRQIVISADRSPSDLDGVEERIKSRLNWGLVADIGPTDYELRLGVLQTKAEAAMAANPGLVFGPKVLEFIAHRIASNVRVLEGALNRLVAHATLVGRPVTVEAAQETLQDLVRSFDRRITIDEIQRKVAEHYNIKLSDMLSPRRARSVARPRQIAMYLAKELTDKSLPEIGRKFGKRDHTTVMHAVKRIAQLRSEDSALDEDVAMLSRTLQF